MYLSRLPWVYDRVKQCKKYSFKTWPSEAGDKERHVVDPAHIFETRLEIIEGNVRNGCIEVVCSNPVEEYDFCGGELNFEADTAAVFDDGGKQYSLEELAAISKSICGNGQSDKNWICIFIKSAQV